MTQKYLLVKGCAGLGNRIFSVLDALNYCIKNNRRLVIDWSDGQFGKKGEDVFKDFFHIDDSCFYEGPLSRIYEIVDCDPQYWRSKMSSSIYDIYQVGNPNFLLKKIPFLFFKNKFKKRKHSLWINKKLGRIKYGIFDVFDENNMTFGGHLENNLQPQLLIYADFNPINDSINAISKIKLKKELEKEINDLASKYHLSEKYVGLHIRYSDKKPLSKIDKIIYHIENEYGDNPIFLATDNEKIEKMIKAHFKNVLTLQKDLPDPAEGRGIHMWGIDNLDEAYKSKMIRSSIMDMWLLSRCKTLFYQGNSSFSRISHLLHSNKNACHDWEKV